MLPSQHSGSSFRYFYVVFDRDVLTCGTQMHEMVENVLMTGPYGELGVNCGNHSTQTHPNYFQFVGSTAAVVLLSNYQTNQIVVVNCRHSGGVLPHNGNTLQLTMAHKPDHPKEHARIQALGGPITRTMKWRSRVENFLTIFYAIAEIITLCFPTTEMGSELSKTVATFIVQKILLDNISLDYICTTAEPYSVVGQVLSSMVAALAKQSPSAAKAYLVLLGITDNQEHVMP